MKKEVETDLANQSSAPTEMNNLAELNVQPTAVPTESVQPILDNTAVGTATPTMNNTFTEKASGLKAKLFSYGVGPVVAIGVILVVAVALLVFGVFGSSPKQVFKSSINKAFKEVEKSIDVYEEYSEKYDLLEKAMLVNFDVSLDTNIKEVTDELDFELKDVNIGAEVGVDIKNEVLHVGANIKGEKEKLDATMQVIEDRLYLKSSLLDKVVKAEEELGLDFGELKDQIKEIEKEYSTDPDDYKYVVKTVRKALVKALDSKYMEKDKEEFELGDKKFKATKYSYILDEDAVQDLLEKVSEYLLDDKEFVKVLSDISGTDKSDIKSGLKEIKKSAKDIEFDEEIAINLYVKGLFNKTIGLGIEYEGDEYVTMIADGKNAEFVFDNHVKDEYGQVKLVATIEEDGKEQKLTVKYNGEKVATGTIREMTEEVIDMTVKLEAEDEKVELDLYVSAKEKKDNISGKYDVKVTYNDEYIRVNGNYGIAIKDKLTKISTKNAVSADEVDPDELLEKIEKKVEKDKALKGVYEAAYAALEEEMLDLNYNGMAEIQESEVAKILAKNKATVLYVGEDYYSSYSDVHKYDMLENLIDAQDEMDFYSYFLDSEYATLTNFKELIKDVEHVCPIDLQVPLEETTPSTGTTTESETTVIAKDCDEFPAIYLIKDGKIQKAFRGTVSAEELEKALTDLGI